MPSSAPPTPAPPGHDLIVIGASAGGVEALLGIARDLPADFPAAICVVLHVPPTSPSMLPRLLTRAGPLPAAHATNGEPLQPGRIYVAPPDYHLLVRSGHLELGRGPRENRCRPAIDVLFRSAAIAYGRRVIGVVLSGTLDDGSAGLLAIKQCGGLAVVQDPDDALFDGMPRNALERVAVDNVAPRDRLAPLLARLTTKPVSGNGVVPVPSPLREEARMTEVDPALMRDATHPGTPATFGCPDCGGTLWELNDERFPRFRCRVGHAFAPDSLLAAQTDGVEEALWAALRALEEKAELAKRLLTRAEAIDQRAMMQRYAEQLAEAEARADLIRGVLFTSAVGRESSPALGD